MRESVLVTGASGYIGSHTVLALIEAGYDVIALEKSNFFPLIEVEKITSKSFKKFTCDLLNPNDLQCVFKNNKIDVVIHLAALKSLNANQTPVDFYNNNIVSLINLLNVMAEYKVRKLIFGSSCAVYGEPKFLPISEDATPFPQNIYARTKYFAEEMLKDLEKADDTFSCIILRIFNPIGAHSSGNLGEDPKKQQVNILTLFAKSVLEKRENLKISPECVRDFIHVMDTAEAHVKAVEKLKTFRGLKIFNIGSGIGTSLKILMDTFKSVSNTKPNFITKTCGDSEIKSIFADINLMENDLMFKPTRSIEKMCNDCWNFMFKNFMK